MGAERRTVAWLVVTSQRQRTGDSKRLCNVTKGS